MATREWSYVYGHPRRGINPRTLKADSRPLGTDKVFLCRPCEWSVLRARLRQLVRENPLVLLGAIAAGAGVASGARRMNLNQEFLTFLAIAAWVAFTWFRRRRKPMCKAIFLHFRRAKLAEAHGLKPSELEPYLDVAA